MLRYRRYRAFVLFVVFALFGTYYYFAGNGAWQPSALGAPSLERFGLSPGQIQSDQKKPDIPKAEDAHKIDLGGERVPETETEKKEKADKIEKPITEDTKKLDLGGERTSESSSTKPKPKPASPKKPSSDPLDEDSTGASKSGKQKEKEKPITKPSTSGHGLDKASGKVPPIKGVPAKDESLSSDLKNTDPEDDLLSPNRGGPGQGSVVPTQEDGNGYGKGRYEADLKVHTTVYWSKQPELFPVTSTIPLPTGTPKTIPRIQHKFGKETETENADRTKKLAAIKAVAEKSWSGYRKHAWMHDELVPITGTFKDPFCGWAATLVDALDTLWIMGMKEEFEEALVAVKKIDFTTSPRDDIPLFETTIRYLGGLLGAYDLSGAKYTVLLDKAVELGEILIGAFDTPNRMPITYYRWKPQDPQFPRRAGATVVLAEIGSLSVEFTRLAQLTKEPKYYDAIDRITDLFVEWQTRENDTSVLPGMFPLSIDASGCGPVAIAPPTTTTEELPSLDLEEEAILDSSKGMRAGVALHSGASAEKLESTTSRKATDGKLSDEINAAIDAVEPGTPSKSKIVAWGEGADESSLDTPLSKPKSTVGKVDRIGEASSKTTSKGETSGEDVGDAVKAASKEIKIGEAGKSKIVAWGDPINEAAPKKGGAQTDFLDDETKGSGKTTSKTSKVAAKEDPLDGLSAGKKDASSSDSHKKSIAEILDDGEAESKVASTLKTSKSQSLDMGSTKHKRQILTGMSTDAENELDSEIKKPSSSNFKTNTKAGLTAGADDELDSKSKLTSSTSSTKSKSKPLVADGDEDPDIEEATFVKPAAAQKSHGISRAPPPVDVNDGCSPQNLTSSNKWGRDRFTLGGMSDSTFEYFPKEYLLLGGLEDKYRELYEKSIDAATKYLLFRPQLPGNKDILIAGTWDGWKDLTTGVGDGQLIPDSGHLDCFAGGMYAMGAKIFNRPEDLEIGAKLTEGCVWAYSVTKTGIMPEGFGLMPCESKTHCEYNQTEYWEKLDPYADQRQKSYELQMEQQKQAAEEALKIGVSSGTGSDSAMAEDSLAKLYSKGEAKNPQNIADSHVVLPDKSVSSLDDSTASAVKKPTPLDRRQLDGEADTASSTLKLTKAKTPKISSSHDDLDEIEGDYDSTPIRTASKPKTPTKVLNSDPSEDEALHPSIPEHGDSADIHPGKPLDYANSPGLSSSSSAGTVLSTTNRVTSPLTPLEQPEYIPPPPPTHAEYVKARIEDERLPAGFVRFESKKYVLRPEAIESVWYLYRITGDKHWRKVGWEMFLAIEEHTSGEFGNSAIDDVTKTIPLRVDSQESFFLAETLKYFYLLFEDEGVVSLDEWVLNTEAHPFRRPDAK